jgi:hypothetical protein
MVLFSSWTYIREESTQIRIQKVDEPSGMEGHCAILIMDIHS